MPPEIPVTANRFILLLKRYAKLNFSQFSESSPILWALVQVIDAIKAFSRVAHDATTIKTKASIIWIILLQSRKFSMGDTEILAEFSTKYTNFSSKPCLIILVEVPAELSWKNIEEI